MYNVILFSSVVDCGIEVQVATLKEALELQHREVEKAFMYNTINRNQAWFDFSEMRELETLLHNVYMEEIQMEIDRLQHEIWMQQSMEEMDKVRANMKNIPFIQPYTEEEMLTGFEREEEEGIEMVEVDVIGGRVLVPVQEQVELTDEEWYGTEEVKENKMMAFLAVALGCDVDEVMEDMVEITQWMFGAVMVACAVIITFVTVWF